MSIRRSQRIRARMMTIVPERNAFLIPDILENFFDQSTWTFEDLRNIRLVCRVWRDASLKLWRSTATVSLLHGKLGVEGTKGILATTFSKHFTDKDDTFLLRKTPFSKYKLLNWELDLGGSGWDNGLKDVKKFWDIFGQSIKELTIEGCNFCGFCPFVFEHIFYIGSPNLTRIAFHSSDCESHPSFGLSALERTLQTNTKIEHLEVMKIMPFRTKFGDRDFGFHTLLSTFPNLQNLKTEECGEELFYQHDSPKISALRLLHADDNDFLVAAVGKRNFPKLRHLDIMHWNLAPLSSDTIRHLNGLKLPLESLSLDLNHTGRSYDELRKIVEEYAGTLRVLKVFVAPFYRPQSFGFVFGRGQGEPSLVEELELWGNVCSNFDFLRAMPKLKKLRMNYDCFEKRKYIENTYAEEAIYIVHPLDRSKRLDYSRVLRSYQSSIRMEHLTEFHIDLEFGKEDFKNFADGMPNLRSFKSVFNSKTFPDFLREWRRIHIDH